MKSKNKEREGVKPRALLKSAARKFFNGLYSIATPGFPTTSVSEGLPYFLLSKTRITSSIFCSCEAIYSLTFAMAVFHFPLRGSKAEPPTANKKSIAKHKELFMKEYSAAGHLVLIQSGEMSFLPVVTNGRLAFLLERIIRSSIAVVPLKAGLSKYFV